MWNVLCELTCFYLGWHLSSSGTQTLPLTHFNFFSRVREWEKTAVEDRQAKLKHMAQKRKKAMELLVQAKNTKKQI